MPAVPHVNSPSPISRPGVIHPTNIYYSHSTRASPFDIAMRSAPRPRCELAAIASAALLELTVYSPSPALRSSSPGFLSSSSNVSWIVTSSMIW